MSTRVLSVLFAGSLWLVTARVDAQETTPGAQETTPGAYFLPRVSAYALGTAHLAANAHGSVWFGVGVQLTQGLRIDLGYMHSFESELASAVPHAPDTAHTISLGASLLTPIDTSTAMLGAYVDLLALRWFDAGNNSLVFGGFMLGGEFRWVGPRRGDVDIELRSRLGLSVEDVGSGSLDVFPTVSLGVAIGVLRNQEVTGDTESPEETLRKEREHANYLRANELGGSDNWVPRENAWVQFTATAQRINGENITIPAGQCLVALGQGPAENGSPQNVDISIRRSDDSQQVLGSDTGTDDWPVAMACNPTEHSLSVEIWGVLVPRAGGPTSVRGRLRWIQRPLPTNTTFVQEPRVLAAPASSRNNGFAVTLSRNEVVETELASFDRATTSQICMRALWSQGVVARFTIKTGHNTRVERVVRDLHAAHDRCETFTGTALRLRIEADGASVAPVLVWRTQ